MTDEQVIEKLVESISEKGATIERLRAELVGTAAELQSRRNALQGIDPLAKRLRAVAEEIVV